MKDNFTWASVVPLLSVSWGSFASPVNENSKPLSIVVLEIVVHKKQSAKNFVRDDVETVNREVSKGFRLLFSL